MFYLLLFAEISVNGVERNTKSKAPTGKGWLNNFVVAIVIKFPDLCPWTKLTLKKREMIKISDTFHRLSIHQ